MCLTAPTTHRQSVFSPITGTPPHCVLISQRNSTLITGDNFSLLSLQWGTRGVHGGEGCVDTRYSHADLWPQQTLHETWQISHITEGTGETHGGRRERDWIYVISVKVLMVGGISMWHCLLSSSGGSSRQDRNSEMYDGFQESLCEC